MKIVKLSESTMYFISITSDTYVLTTGEIIDWDTAGNDIGFDKLQKLVYFTSKEEAQHMYDKIAKTHPEYII